VRLSVMKMSLVVDVRSLHSKWLMRLVDDSEK
jgi:hypothetical protein